MSDMNLSFEQLPQAVATLIEEVKGLKAVLTLTKSELPEADKWFNLQELCEYLPDRPARQTVYGWIGGRLIPFHKKGKKLQFLKSEIDSWLKTDKRKSVAELQTEAQQYVNAKSGRTAR